MRRALLLALAAFAAPAARAQTTTAAPITFTEGTNDLIHGPWISLAECQASKATPDTATVNLGWAMPNYPAGGSYQVYASTAEITTATCPTADSTTPQYKAGTVGANLGNLGASVTLQPVKFADMFRAIKLTGDGTSTGAIACDTVSGDTPIFICVQALDSSQNAVSGAIATGRIILSITKPGAPPTVSATPADTGALEISWTAPSGSPPAYDYRVTAASSDVCGTAPCDPVTHQATDLRTLNRIMDGLVLGATYTIDVYPRSQAGNEGDKAETTAKSVAVANFWDICHNPPYSCPEQGGCATAAAGPVALLAVAALLAKLRRRA